MRDSGATTADVAVIGAGVVGAATALELARRGAKVVLYEAHEAPGLEASGTNSGILHTGFDSPPGELETRLILRAAELRDGVLTALNVPVTRCGAEMRPAGDSQRAAIAAVAENAQANGVQARVRDDGALEVPGEAVTDPVALTLALTAAAAAHGAELRTGNRVVALRAGDRRMVVETERGESLAAAVAVNCAGLGAGTVARLLGDRSFDVYPRKGEFLVFDPPEPLARILLPVPTKRTKGVLVFPTLDGKVVAGPTAVDGDDPDDWSVRPQARDEVLPKAVAMFPPLAEAEPLFSYAGLRPAGRGSNYVIGPSPASDRLINVAAIRSTGLTACLGIAEHVRGLVASAGVELGPEHPLEPGEPPAPDGPWWRRTAERRQGRRAESRS